MAGPLHIGQCFVFGLFFFLGKQATLLKVALFMSLAEVVCFFLDSPSLTSEAGHCP